MNYRSSPRQIEKRNRITWLNGPGVEQHFPDHLTIPAKRLAGFESMVCGKIVYPWSEGYDEDRQEFNNVYPAFPALIVYVVCYTDLRYCLDLAKEFTLQVAVRSGGHSLADYSVCDGLVIDMSALKSVCVDTSTNTVVVEAGCKFEDFVPKIEQYGYHVPTGGCPTVAIAGFMMGGGYSLTSRIFGMNCDCVLEVMVLLANGKIVVANENQNEDLFWAIRGGTGGNFGILLTVKYQLFPLGNIWGIKMTWDIDPDPTTAAKVIFTIQQQYLANNNHPNLGIETVLSADDSGIKKVFFCACFIGNESEFNQTLQPLLSIPGYTIVTKPYGKYSDVNQKVLDGTPDLPEGIKAYSRCAYIENPLSENDWLNILNFFRDKAPNKYSMIDLECYGGKINNTPESTNAFIHRHVLMDFYCDGFFSEKTNDQKKNEEWITSLFNFMATYTNGHSYQNYPNRNQTDFRWAYWGKYYNLLVLIKQKYDPDNFFHYQQSIGPDLADHPENASIDKFKDLKIVYEDF